MTGLKLVVFDLDGTLIDSQDAIVTAMRQAFVEAGLAPPERRDVLEIVGLSLPQALAQLRPGLDEGSVEALTQGYREAAYEQKLHGEIAPLFAGARDAVAALHARQDVILGIATGASRRGLDLVLAAHDLGKFFYTLQTADTHPSKPHPEMLEAALAETGTEAAHAVMVGDSTYDMEMARAAGTGALGVSWGYHRPHDLMRAGAARVIDDFASLEAALDAFWGQA